MCEHWKFEGICSRYGRQGQQWRLLVGKNIIYPAWYLKVINKVTELYKEDSDSLWGAAVNSAEPNRDRGEADQYLSLDPKRNTKRSTICNCCRGSTEQGGPNHSLLTRTFLLLPFCISTASKSHRAPQEEQGNKRGHGGRCTNPSTTTISSCQVLGEAAYNKSFQQGPSQGNNIRNRLWILELEGQLEGLFLLGLYFIFNILENLQGSKTLSLNLSAL